LDKYPVSQGLCCKSLVSSSTCAGWICPVNYILNDDPNVINSTNPSDSVCCLATCDTFDCGIGFNIINDNSTNLSAENCCELNC
jgi:hypothetical protein